MKYFTLLASLLGTLAQAQTPKNLVSPSGYTVETALPTQKVGVDDLISVSVSDCPELTRTFRVAADGTLPLPLLEEKIKANGKYPIEIEREITGALIADAVPAAVDLARGLDQGRIVLDEGDAGVVSRRDRRQRHRREHALAHDRDLHHQRRRARRLAVSGATAEHQCQAGKRQQRPR